MLSALPGFRRALRRRRDVDNSRGGRSQFGNLVLSRLPVLQVYRHLPPWPRSRCEEHAAHCSGSGRRAAWGPVRIITTHLE